MDDRDVLLLKRLHELSERSYLSGIYTESDFLTLTQQDLFLSKFREIGSTPFSLEGGHPSCERRKVIFGSPDLCGYASSPDIAYVRITPKNSKFADDLTHRDFLGALMNLGVRRETMGDIFIRENTAYLFCTQTVARFVAENLDTVKRTSIICDIIDTLPDELSQKAVSLSVNVPSERLDAVISAVYHLSRSESSTLLHSQRVFVNSRTAENGAYSLKENDAVSVRGYGKFIYRGAGRSTKKGRLYVDIEKLV